MAKRTGTTTGGIEVSARWRRKQAARRRREEAEWAAKSGPVTVTFATLEQAFGVSDGGRERAAATPRDEPYTMDGELLGRALDQLVDVDE
jgi:hypothetical protein